MEFDKYILMNKLSQGGFGEIFLGKNKFTEETVIIKQESNTTNSLKREVELYNYLNNSNFFPKLKGFIVLENYSYLILEYLHYNLTTLQNKVTMEQIKNIGCQMIDIITYIHNMKIIHRDIKPENFLMSNGKIKLIDFGFAKKYFDDNHIPFKKINDIIGTPNYISLNIHNLVEPSRRDDLESLIYILLYLDQNIPWKNVSILEKKNMKENFNNLKYIPLIFHDLLNLCRKLDFQEQPNYNLFKNFLNNVN